MGDPRFKNIETKVGLFIIIAVAVIVLTIIAIGINRDLFVPKVHINVFTKTGEGVSKGMTVKYSGFTISRVDDVTLQDDGRVVVTIGIPQKYTKWIKEDSVFKLSALSIIGSGNISIETDLDSTAPHIKNGANFELVRDQDIQALIEQATPVIEDLSEIVSNVNVIMGRVADEEGDISKLLRGVGELGDDLTYGKGSIGYLARSPEIANEVKNLLKDVEKFRSDALKVSGNVVESSNSLKVALEAVEDTSDDIMNNVEGITGNAEEFLATLIPVVDDIQSVVDDIDSVVTQLDIAVDDLVVAAKNSADGTKDLDELRAEIQSIIHTGNRLMLELQTVWPFVEEMPPTQVPLQ